MTAYRNFKLVGYVIYGRGAFSQLDEILAPRRQGDAPMVFLVDHFFQDQPAFLSRIPVRGRDRLLFADVTHEPKTTQVDALRDQIRAELGEVSGIVGIGGGSTMDLAKAVSLMLTNPGSSADYQGWDLVKQPGVYKVAVPTLSGTGAEVSRTTVLTGPTRKLGLNSDFTPFDQIVLDPELIANVPLEQPGRYTLDDWQKPLGEGGLPEVRERPWEPRDRPRQPARREERDRQPEVLEATRNRQPGAACCGV
jgi:3-deoxy-alpha-D-manno-octulosonate 8-oxidase